MIWIIIITAIAFVLIKFLADWNKQNKTLSRSGGVKKKYAKLIEMLQANSNPTIIQSDIDLFAFGWFTPSAGNKLQIIQTFNTVTVKWEFKAKIIALNKTVNLSKEWRFSEDGNQEVMAQKILTEMKQIFDNSEIGNFNI